MNSVVADSVSTSASEVSKPDHEVIIIGAGVCGLYQLYRLVELGVDVLSLEAHSDVGGTWFRNRYPGCRFDSESYTYGYSFSKEVLDEWNWTERFAAQPETLRYLNYVADKFDLKKHVRFNSRVRSAVFDESQRVWQVTLENGDELTTRFLLTAVGLLSVPTVPNFRGMSSFQGPSFHTFDWPDGGIDLEGKRVAVIGTGASGVQVISAVASEVESLTVFQRRPNWCAPLHNAPLDADAMEKIRDCYEEIFERCRRSPSGFIHMPDGRRTLEVPEDERRAFWEELYNSPGFGIWFGNFRDTLLDEEANAALTAFVADKIRERVHDPEVAEKLIPKDHGFGTRRVPLETGYYETYNRPNVRLVDLTETPIEEIVPTGLRTTSEEFEFDVIVYATGFDAITGAFDQIEFRGTREQTLKETWDANMVTTLGVAVTGFPNLLILVGPQGGSVATNFPRGIEEVVDWTTTFLAYLFEHGHTRVEAQEEAQIAWVHHVKAMAERMLLSKAKSWFTGYNSNLDRANDEPRQLIYTGGLDRYRERLQQEVSNGFASFTLS